MPRWRLFYPLVWAPRSRAPMLPLSLFRSRTFVGATLLTLALYAAGIGGSFFPPFNLIQVQGYSPLAAGAAQIPFVLITFALSRWAGGLVGRVGGKPPLVIGPLGVALGFLLFARPGIGGSHWTTFFPAMVVAGLGMAVSVAPLTATTVGAVGPEHAGLASGVNNATSRLAGLLAFALVGIVVTGAFEEGLDRRVAALRLPPDATAELAAGHDRLAAPAAPAGLTATETVAVERAVDEAFVAAFRRAMLATAGVTLAGAVAAGLLIEGKAPPAAGGEDAPPARPTTRSGDGRGDARPDTLGSIDDARGRDGWSPSRRHPATRG